MWALLVLALFTLVPTRAAAQVYTGSDGCAAVGPGGMFGYCPPPIVNHTVMGYAGAPGEVLYDPSSGEVVPPGTPGAVPRWVQYIMSDGVGVVPIAPLGETAGDLPVEFRDDVLPMSLELWWQEYDALARALGEGEPLPWQEPSEHDASGDAAPLDERYAPQLVDLAELVGRARVTSTYEGGSEDCTGGAREGSVVTRGTGPSELPCELFVVHRSPLSGVAYAQAADLQGATSLLVDDVTHEVLAVSDGVIARQVSYAYAEEGSHCAGDAPSLSPQTPNWFRVRCDTRGDQGEGFALWSPASLIVHGGTGEQASTATDRRGYYTLPVVGTEGEEWEVYGEVRYQALSPRQRGGSFFIGGWSSELMDGDLENHVNFAVSTIMFSGRFRLENSVIGEEGCEGEGECACYVRPESPPEGFETWTLWAFGGIPLVAAEDATTALLRGGETEHTLLAESSCGVDHRGLLTAISARDLANTSFYVFRDADGRMIGSRSGLSIRDMACDETVVGGTASPTTCPVVDPHGRAMGSAVFMSRGPMGVESDRRSPAMQFELAYQASDAETALNSGRDRTTPPIRPGDALTVVAVNHATGYVGTVHTTVSYGELSAVMLPDLVLRPPNLRVWASRHYKVAAGATAGEDREFTIGSEGSALTSDSHIWITTEWVDADGSPLPAELPSFTGRYAQSDAPSLNPMSVVDAGAEGFDVGEFPIRPGRQTQVLELPTGAVERGHIYVHVSAESREFARGEERQPRLFDSSWTCVWSAGEPDASRLVGDQLGLNVTGERCGDGQDNNFNDVADEGCPPGSYDCYSRAPREACQPLAECEDEHCGGGPCAEGECDDAPESCECVDRRTCFEDCSEPTCADCVDGEMECFLTCTDDPCHCEEHPDYCYDERLFLEQRPWHYVPVLVPQYNAERTEHLRRDAVAGGLSNPGPIYDWVYRPELHYSVVEFSNVAVDRLTPDSSVVSLLDDAEPELRPGDQAILSDGELGEPDDSELERAGSDREYEFLSEGQTGEWVEDPDDPDGGYWRFAPDEVSDLDQDALATIWLAQNGDEGNALWEFAFSQPTAVWVKRHHHSRFADAETVAVEPFYDEVDPEQRLAALETFEFPSVLITERSRASVWVTGEIDGEERECLLVPTLPHVGDEEPDPCAVDPALEGAYSVIQPAGGMPESYRFAVQYQDIERLGFSALENPDFQFEVRLRSEPALTLSSLPIRPRSSAIAGPELVVYAESGRLVDTRTGVALGGPLERGTRLFDGAQHLTRPDVEVGNGPYRIALTRTYSNVRDEDGILGPGWSFAELEPAVPLTFHHADFHRVPAWIAGLEGFLDEASVEEARINARGEWDGVLLGGETFIETDSGWFSEDGRFGQLNAVVTEDVPEGIHCGWEQCLALEDARGTTRYYARPGSPRLSELTVETADPVSRLLPYTARFLGSEDAYGNVLAVRYYASPEFADEGCASAAWDGLPCEIDASGNVCRFEGYSTVRDPDSRYGYRLNSLVCGEGESGELRVTYVANVDGYLETVVRTVEGVAVSTERYFLEPEATPNGPRNIVRLENAGADLVVDVAYCAEGSDAAGLGPEVIDDAQRASDTVCAVTRQPVVPIAPGPCAGVADDHLSFVYTAGGDGSGTRTVQTGLSASVSTIDYELDEFGHWTRLEDGGATISEVIWQGESADDGMTYLHSATIAYEGESIEVVRVQDDRGRETRREVVDGETTTTTTEYDGDHVRSVTDELYDTVVTWGREAGLLNNVQRGEYEQAVAQLENGLLESFTPPGATESTTLGYDERGYVNRITPASGETPTIIRRDATGRVRQIKRGDRVTTVEWEGNGVTTTRPEPGGESRHGRVSHTILDADGRTVAETDVNGVTYAYSYNARGQVVRVQRDAPGLPGATLRRDYDAEGRLVGETDWRGQWTCYEYEDLGFGMTAMRATPPLGETTTTLSDWVGNVTRVEHAGTTVEMTYDAHGRMETRSTTADGTTLEEGWAYVAPESGRGVQVEYTDPTGLVATSRVDAEGHLRSVQRPGLDADEYFYLNGVLVGEMAGGVPTTYDYDAGGRLTRTALGALDAEGATTFVTDLAYDDWGNVERIVRRDGAATRTLTVEHDAWGRPYRTSDDLGPLATLAFDGLGNVEQETHDNGRVVQTPRDALGRVLGVSDSADNGAVPALVLDRSLFEYDANGNLELHVARDGTRTTVSYDALGRPLSTCVNEVLCTSTDYSQLPRLLTKTAIDGTVTAHAFDGFGRPEETTVGGRLLVHNTYEGARLVATTDRHGLTTELGYDHESGLPTTETLIGVPTMASRSGAPERVVGNLVYTTHYDGYGRPTALEDPTGYADFMEYDARGAVERLSRGRWEEGAEALGSATQVSAITYNGFGEPETSTDGNGHQTTTTYDERGRVRTVTHPELSVGLTRELVETYVYDDAAQTVHYTNTADTVGDLLTYDDAGRLIREARGLGGTNAHTYVYDLHGQVAVAKTPLRHTTRYAYDALGGLERVEDPMGGVVTVDNNYAAGTTTISGGPIGTRRYVYGGPFGALSQITEDGTPLMHATGWTQGGLPTQVERPGPVGLVTDTATYDGLGRVETFASGGIAGERYYDALGQLAHVEVAQPTGLVRSEAHTFFHDEWGQVFGERRTIDGQTHVIRRRFDTVGNVTGIDIAGNPALPMDTCASDTCVAYAYDARDRISAVLVGGAEETSYGYEADGMPRSATRPNGVTTSYGYHPQTRELGAITHTAEDGTVLASVGYAYDLDGNRETETLRLGDETRDTVYGHDARGRLTRVSATPGDIDPATDEVTYREVTHTLLTYNGFLRATESDHLGGTVSEAGEVVGGALQWTDTYTYVDRQLEQVSRDAADDADDGVTAYTYDGAGNLVARTDPEHDWAFTYDDLNRMVTASRGPPTSDPEAGRYDAAYGYDYAGRRVEVEDATGTAWMHYDGLDLIQAGSTIDPTQRHIYGPLGLERIQRGAGGYEYAVLDALGSTMAMTGTGGALGATYVTDPWGNLEGELTAGLISPQVFTGHQQDIATGLFYANARYYDPGVGRFTTADTYLGGAAPPLSLDRYLYAYGSPTRYVDPTGHAPEWGELLLKVATGMGTGYSPMPPAMATHVDPSVFPNGTQYVATGGVMLVSGGVIIMSGGAAAPVVFGGALSFASAPAMVVGGAYMMHEDLAGRDTSDIRGALDMVGALSSPAGMLVTTGTLGVTGDQDLAVALGGMAQLVEGVGPIAARRLGALGGARARGTTPVRFNPCGGLCLAEGTEVVTGELELVPIESVRLGDRVATVDGGSETEVDETWRIVEIEMSNPESRDDIVRVELLRPQQWLADNQVDEAGDTVWLDMDEIGLDGFGRVISIRGPPAIDPEGEGRVVLSTITHINRSVHALTFEESDLELRPTAPHRFYSLDRDDWIRTDELRVGERVETYEGEATIASIARVEIAERVYNIEVEYDHEYLVTELELRSHNTGAGCRTRVLANIEASENARAQSGFREFSINAEARYGTRGTRYEEIANTLANGRVGRTRGGVNYGSYDDLGTALRQRTGGRGQAHHVNQDAVFNDVIPTADGASIELFGNVFARNADRNSRHYKFHQFLELDFWDQFRLGTRNGTIATGSRYAPNVRVTVAEYNQAVFDAARYAGFDVDAAYEIVRIARANQAQHGLALDSLLPIPGRIPNVRTR